MTSLKARDLKGIKDEMLKWKGKEAHAWVDYLFNQALQHGMPYDWSKIGSNLTIKMEM